MNLSRYLVSVAFVIQIFTASGQTATSIANGPWLSPFTWNCTCVPTPGYTVIINHHITLNTSFEIPSGSITVNTSASLIQDANRDILINGGSLTNNGKTQFRYLEITSGSVTNTDSLELKSFLNYGSITNSGSITKLDSFLNIGIINNSGTIQSGKFFNQDSLLNNGIFTGVDSFYNNGRLRNNGSITTPTFTNNNILNNTGSISGVDSMTNSGTFHNYISGVMNADSVWNPGSFTNEGTVRNKSFLNTTSMVNTGYWGFIDLYNTGTVVNSDSMQGLHSLYNFGRITNLVGGRVLLGGSFWNVDSFGNHPMFDNEWIVLIDSNWYNGDTVRGTTGKFRVAFESTNTGVMLGSFDFCDLTPPASAPFVDINTGYISPGITWCQDTTTDIKNVLYQGDIFLFPTVTNDLVTLTIPQPDVKNVSWTIYDISGRPVMRPGLESSYVQQIHTSPLASGMYIIRVSINGSFIERKFIKL